MEGAPGTFKYRPVSPINRDAMAAFLYRLAGAPAFTPTTQSFGDVPPGTQFYAEIEWLATTGISTGWGVGDQREYRPLQPINRDAMAAFLYRFVMGGPTPGANTCGDQRHGRDWETLPTTKRVVALTFDGGASNAAVDRILSTLRAKDVPATFFVTGDFA